MAVLKHKSMTGVGEFIKVGSGTEKDIVSKTAGKSLSEPFKGTELDKPADAIDKATGWLDKKMADWAGKKTKEEESKK